MQTKNIGIMVDYGQKIQIRFVYSNVVDFYTTIDIIEINLTI